MINLQTNNKYKRSISQMQLSDKLSRILELAGLDSESKVSVRIDSDELLKNLNKQYRGFDQPTDVLSFESNMVDPETGCLFLGDIVISYETAEKQAQEADHPLENEIILLLIHGILHLSGLDHATKSQKDAMWQKQQMILDKLDVKINRISGDKDFHD